MPIVRAEFAGGFTDLNALPRARIPEIAVIGRSNVGKSTFVNRLCGRRELAQVSSKPGHTRELNFFRMEIPAALREKAGRVHEAHLVDLPGFGYAKFSRSQREQLWEIVHEYLLYREQLKVVVLLNDCRREPEAEELAIQRLTFEAERHLLVVLTKVDKLSRNQRDRQIEKIAHGFGLARNDVEISSTTSGADDAGRRILPRLARLLAA